MMEYIYKLKPSKTSYFPKVNGENKNNDTLENLA